jgi:carboxyl-terminal processing protease
LGFKVSDALLNDFIAAAEAEEIKRNDADIQTSGNFIRRQLRAIIANQIWGISEFYECINESNPIVKEALIQMKSDNFKKLKLRY